MDDSVTQTIPVVPASAKVVKVCLKAPGDGAEVWGSSVELAAAGPELLGAQLLAVDKLGRPEPDVQRDELYPVGLSDIVREVGGSVAHHSYCHVAPMEHLQTG